MGVLVLMVVFGTFFRAERVFLFFASVQRLVDDAFLFKGTQCPVEGDAVDLIELVFDILVGERFLVIEKYFEHAQPNTGSFEFVLF